MFSKSSFNLMDGGLSPKVSAFMLFTQKRYFYWSTLSLSTELINIIGSDKYVLCDARGKPFFWQSLSLAAG